MTRAQLAGEAGDTMSESPIEKGQRLEAMSQDDGETWDLSDNDRAACAAGAAAIDALLWRDISTAPKDGTWILVSHPEWRDGRWEIAVWSDYTAGWITYQTSIGPKSPTHWMPLPEPPQ